MISSKYNEYTFLTSDNHFQHENIIKYSNRPFSSVKEMNECMVENWNNSVTSDEYIVYDLGDVCLGYKETMRDIVSRLNGRIRLLKGNHEGVLNVAKDRFEWVKDYHEESFEINGNSQKIVMCHYPIEDWNCKNKKSWMIHGHSHGILPNKIPFRFDVGVDSVASYLTQKDRDSGLWNSIKNNPKHYRPISLIELAEIFEDDYAKSG